MAIKVKIKTVYGNDLIYPVCEHTKTLRASPAQNPRPTRYRYYQGFRLRHRGRSAGTLTYP